MKLKMFLISRQRDESKENVIVPDLPKANPPQMAAEKMCAPRTERKQGVHDAGLPSLSHGEVQCC